MKVLVFTTLYPNNVRPNFGVFIKERMTAFARRPGCEIKVVAPVPYFPPLKVSHRWHYSQVLRKETIEGVEVYHPRYLMIPKIGMSLHGMMLFLSVQRFIKRLRRDFKFDLIDAHYVYPDGFAAVLLGRFFNKPVVVSARGSDIHKFPEFRVIRQLIIFTLQRAAAVIAVSYALKAEMVDLGINADKICVIPNGINRQKFFPIPKTEARKSLGLPDKRIVLSVGALIPGKGFDLLIDAIDHISKTTSFNDIRLYIIGEGKLRKKLESIINKRGLSETIILIGLLQHHELNLWFNSADVFCLASSREGFPNVLCEALACGTPVIASRVGGAPEIVFSEEIGYLVERNPEELAEKIIRALMRTWDKDKLISATKLKNWDELAEEVQAVFQSALDVRMKKESANPMQALPQH